ncbi:hypothetical protein V9T40_007878 [Parthenolecanium corni]
MEHALEQLKETVAEAEDYLKKSSQTVAYVKFYIQNIEEDIAVLAATDSIDDNLADRALQLRIHARRIKRTLDVWLIENNKPTPSGQINANAGREPDHKPQIKLEKLTLPTFDGDPTKFLVYWNTIVENVVNNPDVSDTAKWVYLRNSLKGRPAELLADMPETAASIQTALTLLSDIYGGDERSITELYRKFHNLTPATATTESIRLTHAKLESYLLALEGLQHSVNENQYIRSVYIGKFPEALIQDVVTTKNIKLKDIRAKINQILLARESTQKQIIHTAPPPVSNSMVMQTAIILPTASQPSNMQMQAINTPAIPNAVNSATAGPMLKPKCVFCEIRHWADECPQYTTAEQRRNRAPDRCIKCIRPAHPGTECQRQRRCAHCDSLQHNRAFCPVKFPSNSSENRICVVREAPTPSWVAKKGCFFTCITQVSTKKAPTPYEVRVLIDTAGSRSLITKRTADRLRLRATSDVFRYSGIEGHQTTDAPAIDEPIQFHAIDGSMVTIGAYITDTLVQDVAVPDIETFKASYPQYKDMHIPPTGKSLPIDILIGGDNLVDFVLFDRGYVVDENHQLMATKLGWLIATRHNKSAQNTNEAVLLINDDDHIKQMFDLEMVGLADFNKAEFEAEQVAIDKFHRDLEFNNTRYDIAWPYVDKNPQLSTNYGPTLGRLKTQWRKMQHQPKLLMDYHQIIQKQVTTIKQDNIREFRYVPSQQNRADVATRGADYQRLVEQTWWQTPAWLAQGNRPKNEINTDTEKETLLVTTEAEVTQKIETAPVKNTIGVATINSEHYSSLHSPLQSTANCIEAAKRFGRRKLEGRYPNPYEAAKTLWIRWDQCNSNLQQASMHKFRVYTDENGIVRCSTRIQKASVLQETKDPILLVKGSKLTELIILHIHTMNMHTGTTHTLAILRTQYYLPQARRQIFEIINASCYKCKRQLTYISRDTEELILTPAHFLGLKYPAVPIHAEITQNDDIMTKLWKAAQQYLAEFWQYWSESYVLALRNRDDKLKNKPRNVIHPPKKGDIVLLADPDRKRVQWRIALVERLVTSGDGVVRSAQIKLPNGTRTIRPIIKLAPMDLNIDLPNVDDQQLNRRRDAIVLRSPEGAAGQLQQQINQEDEDDAEVVELGLYDVLE